MWALIFINLAVHANEVDVMPKYVSEFKSEKQCYYEARRMMIDLGDPVNVGFACVERTTPTKKGVDNIKKTK